MKTLLTTLSVLLLAGSALALQDGDQAKKSEATDATVIANQLPSYPTTKCVISDEPLDAMDGAIDVVHEGRLVRLCCKGCKKQLKKDPAKVIAQIDALVVKEQLESYPLETCPISGEELGGMGDPVNVVHGTRLVRLCCKGCVKKFKADPAATMAKIDAALIAEQTKTYPLSTCVVSGMEIEGEGESMLYGTQLVRFCCPKCKGAFAKEPQEFLAKVNEAKGMEKSKAKEGI